MNPSSARGAALPLVLWAVFVMSTVVVVALGLVDFDIDLEANHSRRFVARQAALTGLAFAMNPQVKRGDPLLFQPWGEDGARFEVQIQSEDARLNINSLLLRGDTTVLKELFRFWGLDERQAAVAVDSLKDWVDPDEFRSLNGAEAADLRGDTEFSLPENRPFLRVAEMERVRGMEAVRRAKPDWANYFSVKSSNRLDIRDASPDLLQVVGRLTREQAAAVVRFRNGPDGKPGTPDDPELKSAEQIATIVPLNQAQMVAIKANFGSGGTIRRIISRGISGDIVHEISVITGAASVGSQPSYLEWSEN